MLLEPHGEPLVQLGPGRLRQGVVGGVADQQVAEPERVLAREAAPCPAGRAPCARATSAARPPAARPVRAPGPRRGGRRAPRRRRARARSARGRRAGRGGRRGAPGSSAGRRRRSPATRATIATISSTNSGLPSAASRMRSRRPVVEVGEALDQAVGLGRRRAARAGRWSRSPSRPPSRAAGRAAPAAPCRAAGSARRARGRRRARPGRGRSPRPSARRRTRRRPASRRRRPRAACGTPRRSPRSSVTARPLAGDRLDRRRRGRLDARLRELLDDLDDRPVGDALAVRAGSGRGPTSAPSSEARNSATSLDLPTPAAPRTVNRWQERSGDDPLPGLREHAALPLPSDHRRVQAAGEALVAVHGQQPVGRARARSCPSGRAARPPRPRRRRARAAASPRRSGSPRAAPPAASRAATLTASPVASRSSVPVTTSPVVTPIRPWMPSSGKRVAHLDRRPQRTQRVVLVHDRHAEHGHHRVADELLHRAAVPLDDRLHPLEVAGEQRAQRLRVELLAELGRAGDVAEEDRDDLALLARCHRGGDAARRSAGRRRTPRRSRARSSRRPSRAEATPTARGRHGGRRASAEAPARPAPSGAPSTPAAERPRRTPPS